MQGPGLPGDRKTHPSTPGGKSANVPASETHRHSSEAHSTQLPACVQDPGPSRLWAHNDLECILLLVGAPIPLSLTRLSLSGITHQLSFLNPNPCLKSTSDGNRTEHHSQHQGAICSAELTRGPSPGGGPHPGGGQQEALNPG